MVFAVGYRLQHMNALPWHAELLCTVSHASSSWGSRQAGSMQKKKLGSSDLEVPVVCLGTMTFGEQVRAQLWGCI